MKRPTLRQFLQAVAAEPALQAENGAARDLAGLMQIAQAAFFALTARELQLWAHDEAFTTPWGSWSSGGHAQRDGFFYAASPDDNQLVTDLEQPDYSE